MASMIRVPYHADIPEPVMVTPPDHDLTSEGVYIPSIVRPHVKLSDDSDISHARQLSLLYDRNRFRRWMLPSWGWVGVRTNYDHTDADWETFRRKIVSAYRVLDTDEGDKFRIIWLEYKEKLDGADDTQTREFFQAWFADHCDPPDGHYSVIPTIKEVWSGYETMACLVADKETIDSVLADKSDTVDESASLKVLDRGFNEQDMRNWAPKLLGRYRGSFQISPHFLPTLDGRLDEDSIYGQMGSPSAWYLESTKVADGVLRERRHMDVDEGYGKDPVHLAKSSNDDDSDGGEDERSKSEL